MKIGQFVSETLYSATFEIEVLIAASAISTTLLIKVESSNLVGFVFHVHLVSDL